MPLFEYKCVACGYTSEELMPAGIDTIQCQSGTGCTGLAKKVQVSLFSPSGLSKGPGKKSTKYETCKICGKPKIVGVPTITEIHIIREPPGRNN